MYGDPRDITRRIKEARVQAGLTQPEMAEALGMQLRGYQHYEAQSIKHVRVPWRKLDQIADLTGVSPQWLVHGDNIPGGDEVGERLIRLEAMLEQMRHAMAGEQQAEWDRQLGEYEAGIRNRPREDRRDEGNGSAESPQ